MNGRKEYFQQVAGPWQGEHVVEGGVSVSPARGCTAMGDPELKGQPSPGRTWLLAELLLELQLC